MLRKNCAWVRKDYREENICGFGLCKQAPRQNGRRTLRGGGFWVAAGEGEVYRKKFVS